MNNPPTMRHSADIAHRLLGMALHVVSIPRTNPDERLPTRLWMELRAAKYSARGLMGSPPSGRNPCPMYADRVPADPQGLADYLRAEADAILARYATTKLEAK